MQELERIARVHLGVRLTTIAAGLATFLGLLSASSADAAQIHPRHFPGVPVISAGGALWAEGAGPGGIAIWSGKPARAPRRVGVFRPERPKSGQYLGATLAASDAVALVNTYAFTDMGRLGVSGDYTEVQVGSPAGPFQLQVRCPGQDVSLRSVDASHDAYVWRQCDGGAGHVEIRDPNAPAQGVGKGGFGARIAGRYVAWLDGKGPYTGVGPGNETDIAVYDRVTKTEVYRIPRTALPGPVQSLDVQEDGKIAFVFQTDQHTRRLAVGWASPQSPIVHRLPLAQKNSYDVHMSHDTIAFQRGNTDGDLVVQRAEVGISDLAGRIKILGRGTDDSQFQESFDYDGKRLLWRELGCERPRLVIIADTARTQAGPPRRCPLKLLRRPAYKNGRVTFRFGCGAFLKPCFFDVWLRTTGRHGAPVGRNLNGDRNPVRVRLSGAARRRLSTRGVIRLAVKVALFDNAGRSQTRRAFVIVRR